MAAGSAELIENALRRVKSQDAFIQDLLVDALGWPIEDEVENIEDLTFEWSVEDLKAEGIDEKIADGVVRQIRPFPGNPWGIFLVEFKHPEIFKTGYGMTGVLRKVLRGLVEKKRASTTNLAAFNRENLLFICKQLRSLPIRLFQRSQWRFNDTTPRLLRLDARRRRPHDLRVQSQRPEMARRRP